MNMPVSSLSTRSVSKQPPALTKGVGLYLQRKCACGASTSSLSGTCEECRNKLPRQLQRRAADHLPQASSIPAVVHDVLRSPGQALDRKTCKFMEPRFAHDFSRVRVHADAQAAESARAIHALAYTSGNDVVFGAHRYAPESAQGSRLLAHELAHVVQQSNAGSVSASPDRISSASDVSEKEADEAVSQLFDKPSQPLNLNAKPGSSLPFLQRQEDPEKLPAEGPETAEPAPDPAPAEGTPVTPADAKPAPAGRTDKFGKECPETVDIQDKKAIPPYDKSMYDAGYKTYFGLVSNMKVGPKSSYEACISEVLKVEENTCGEKGNMAGYEPCGEKTRCLTVGKDCGGDPLTKTTFPCSANTFVDLHKTHRKESMLEGSGLKECKVKCLQRYGCGGKEIGRFYITRNFKAGEYSDGKTKVHVTTGSIEKEPAGKSP